MIVVLVKIVENDVGHMKYTFNKKLEFSFYPENSWKIPHESHALERLLFIKKLSIL